MSIFNNLKVAFKDKSNFELKRSLLIFSIISNPIISKTLITLTKILIKLRIPISFIIKNTIFKQFCGGTNIDNARKTIDKLWKSKIGSILDYSVEGKDKEVDFKRVKNETINNIIKASKSSKIPFAVFKPTGLTKFSLLEKINNYIILAMKSKDSLRLESLRAVKSSILLFKTKSGSCLLYTSPSPRDS